MANVEGEIVRWLTHHAAGRCNDAVALGVGDDMAILNVDGGTILVTADMLLEGVHFDGRSHSLEDIGRKAIACSLSDCAAMAVRPTASVVSLALPAGWNLDKTKRLYRGLNEMAGAFDCPIIGGDTTGWDQRLAIDVSMLARPYPGLTPVRRSGARPGDTLFVTGALGGSLLGRHLSFTPRVVEARRLSEQLGDALHAMMDISDGLSLDLHRLCSASGVGAVLEETLLRRVVHADAEAAAKSDGRDPLEHALGDGEDFELLVAVDPAFAVDGIDGVALHPIGSVAEAGLCMRTPEGVEHPLAVQGFEHLS